MHYFCIFFFFFFQAEDGIRDYKVTGVQTCALPISAGSNVAVLVDLQGPRIRVGALPQPRALRPGETVVFAPEEVAKSGELPTTYAGLATDARVGARILLDDGLLSVEVTGIAPPRVEGRVVDGGTLTSHKGMNLPGLQVSAPALTAKDREDVTHAVKAGVEYLALSFVRRAEDLAELPRLVPPAIKLIAQIEKATALRSEEHTSELQSPCNLVCRLLLEKKKQTHILSLNE